MSAARSKTQKTRRRTQRSIKKATGVTLSRHVVHASFPVPREKTLPSISRFLALLFKMPCIRAASRFPDRNAPCIVAGCDRDVASPAKNTLFATGAARASSVSVKEKCQSFRNVYYVITGGQSANVGAWIWESPGGRTFNRSPASSAALLARIRASSATPRSSSAWRNLSAKSRPLVSFASALIEK